MYNGTNLPKPLKEDAWLAEWDALKPSLKPNEKDCEAEWLRPAPLALLLTLAVRPPVPVGATLKPPPNPKRGLTGFDCRFPSPGNRVLGSRSKCSNTGSTGGVIGSNLRCCLTSSGNTKPSAGTGTDAARPKAMIHTHAKRNIVLEIR